MPALIDLIREGHTVQHHGPWPRAVVDQAAWRFAVGQLAEAHWSLLGLWGEQDAVHMALLDPPAGEMAVVSLACPQQRYPSVAAHHPPALRLERTIRDLFGLEPEGLPDVRPWLDHDRWGLRHPLGARQADPPALPPYEFLP